MRILVTGGTGFIGSNLCEKLINQGHYVLCLDNNFTGSMENIKNLRNNMNFEFIRHDVTNPISLEIDQIYHLACPASPNAYQDNPIKTIKTNVLGTLNILGLARRTKAKFLLTSTSEVYGDPKISPQVEEYWGNVNPIGVRSCYDEGKRLAEALTFEYYRTHNVDIKIARIFNTYGPNMNPNDGRVISNFINQCISNKDITIFGDGFQTRDFIHVGDVVQANINSASSYGVSEAFNIASGTRITINDLVKLITKNYKKNIIINYGEKRPGDVMHSLADISFARNKINFNPIISLEDGIEEYVNWAKNFYNK